MVASPLAVLCGGCGPGEPLTGAGFRFVYPERGVFLRRDEYQAMGLWALRKSALDQMVIFRGDIVMTLCGDQRAGFGSQGLAWAARRLIAECELYKVLGRRRGR